MLKPVAMMIACTAVLVGGCGKCSKSDQDKRRREPAKGAEKHPDDKGRVSIGECLVVAGATSSSPEVGGAIIRGGKCKAGEGPPQVRIARPTVTGSLDTAVIRRYLRRGMPGIRACYQAALSAMPELEGTVEVDFTIDSNGKASAVKAEGMDAKVAECVKGEIAKAVFPKPRAGAVASVHYPIVFRPCVRAPAGRAPGGRASASAVTAHLRDNLEILRACYRTARETGPLTVAAVRLDIAISSDGVAGHVLAVGTPKTPPALALHACVTDAVKAMQFPVSPDGRLLIRCPLGFGDVAARRPNKPRRRSAKKP